MERQGQIRTYTGEVTWGAKCVAIIDCISDAEVIHTAAFKSY